MTNIRLFSLGILGLALVSCTAGESALEKPLYEPARLIESHYDEGEPMWVGTIDRANLEEPPFDEWFDSGYASYTPDAKTVEALASSMGSVDVEVYLGTWCSDSTRDVPRLERILDEAGLPPERLEMVALSDHPGEFKTSPGGKERLRRIHRTPTIVVSRDGHEIGRIVQNSRESLEKDLLTIVRGEAYEPRFGAESRFHELFTNEPVEVLEEREAAIADELSGLGDADSLWHYAQYDLLLNDKPREAVVALDIFLRLHPDSAKGHLLRAEALDELGNTAEALSAVRESLRYDPDNEKAQSLERRLSE